MPPRAEPEVPPCSSVPPVVNEFPNRETIDHPNPTSKASSRPSRLSGGGEISPATQTPQPPLASRPDNDLPALRANIKSLVIKNLLASPFLTRFYVDSVISNFPNSNAAKILARNYQKIMNRISMPNPKSCTHIKVTGVRCQAPALRGEQFCYFHQHAHRGVRRPAHSRLHPIALIESEEAIQASLMEVINGLIRNTLDVKRAELIIRALHIAVKNARHTRFDSNVYPKVREVPQYAEPQTDNVDAAAIAADEYLPAVAAVPYKPVDPRDPHFLERMEEGGRVLARQAAARQAAALRDDARRAAEAKAAQAVITPAGSAHVGTAAPGCPGREATASIADAQRLPHPSRLSKDGNPEAQRPQRKPPVKCESRRKDNSSSKGAKECSPARKRWVGRARNGAPHRDYFR